MLLKDFKISKENILQGERFEKLGNRFDIKYLKWEQYRRMGIFEQEKIFLR